MTFARPPAVELRGVTKRFGNILANDSVSLRVEQGTIHGIIGENGAGKSTAMKILYGLYQPDAGEFLVRGSPAAWRSPADAINSGLGMVHQDFMLAGRYSTLDNIVLGARESRWGFLNRRAVRERLNTLAGQEGTRWDWDEPVEQLPVGTQQRIEILKLLYRDCDILILDEPTAVLTPQQTTALFDHLRTLRTRGKTVLLVTHKLKEIMWLTDRVTVFRRGRVVGDFATADTDPGTLATLMIGRSVATELEVPAGVPQPALVLQIDAVSLSHGGRGRPSLSGVSFAVHRGEIVGLAGVQGSGQSDLLQALLHPAEPQWRSSGSVKILGRDVTGWTAARILELGVGWIPEDRWREGLLLQQSVADNFLLSLERLHNFSRLGFLRRQKIERACVQAIAEFDIRPADPAVPAGNLSGGNQQKLVIARALERKPQLVIAAQPTRGLDAGAVEFIHKRLLRARDEGAGVLLVSFDLDEILALSDRILVMFEGKITGQFRGGATSTSELGLKMSGG